MNVKLTVVDDKGTGFLPTFGVIDAVKIENEEGIRYQVTADSSTRFLREDQVQVE
jgi:hypothetical protein